MIKNVLRQRADNKPRVTPVIADKHRGKGLIGRRAYTPAHRAGVCPLSINGYGKTRVFGRVRIFPVEIDGQRHSPVYAVVFVTIKIVVDRSFAEIYTRKAHPQFAERNRLIRYVFYLRINGVTVIRPFETRFRFHARRNFPFGAYAAKIIELQSHFFKNPLPYGVLRVFERDNVGGVLVAEFEFVCKFRRIVHINPVSPFLFLV